METTTSQISCPAKQLNASDKKRIALDIISNTTTMNEAASNNNVSRKFVRRQKEKVITAIDDAFSKTAANDDEKILFYIPVTKSWLAMVIMCLLLYARCPFRGIQKIFNSAFDYNISLGTIHNISNDAIKKSTAINAKEDLSQVVLGAHDKKFHYNQPILSGTDIRSLYCYLLSMDNVPRW